MSDEPIDPFADPIYFHGNPHPLCAMIRELRKAKKMSLARFEELTGIPSVVIGSYERGDRIPGIAKLDRIFAAFGYRLVAVPAGADHTWLPTDMVRTLRAFANQIESLEAAEDDIVIDEPAPM